VTEAEFDRVADEELHALERSLSQLDPDELEVELSQGVLTLTLADDQQIVINSHRAAGQIWMAAFRTAWHFSPRPDGGTVVWRTDKDELHATLRRILGEKLAKPISV